MKVLVTGASGFLGQYVVVAALRQGHQVMAMVRSPKAGQRPSQPRTDGFSWHNHPNVELVRADLGQPDELAKAVAPAEAVIHLAAVKSGSFEEQMAGTVTATKNLLEAMGKAGVQRLIAISTFSVYDYLAKPAGSLLDETFPIEDEPMHRDGYARTKLMQEALYRDFERDREGLVTILRPGMIYGRDNLWNPCLGLSLGSRLWLRFGADAIMPLTYVENCAEAIVNALVSPEAIGSTLNIVDDPLPTRKAFGDALVQRTPHTPWLIPVSWGLAQGVADLAWAVDSKILKGKVRLPGILVPARLQARFKPFRYSNDKAKQQLRWQPRYGLNEALERSFGEQDLLVV
jgi:nucleoside-diphosphate-sugar epimerase